VLPTTVVSPSSFPCLNLSSGAPFVLGFIPPHVVEPRRNSWESLTQMSSHVNIGDSEPALAAWTLCHTRVAPNQPRASSTLTRGAEEIAGCVWQRDRQAPSPSPRPSARRADGLCALDGHRRKCGIKVRHIRVLSYIIMCLYNELTSVKRCRHRSPNSGSLGGRGILTPS